MRVRDKVEDLLANNSDNRNSDKKLMLAFWESEGLSLTEEQRRDFLNCTPAESITRARRDLAWKYPASREVKQARDVLAERAKQRYSPHKAIPWMDD